jgi:hypothetical protein
MDRTGAVTEHRALKLHGLRLLGPLLDPIPLDARHPDCRAVGPAFLLAGDRRKLRIQIFKSRHALGIVHNRKATRMSSHWPPPLKTKSTWDTKPRPKPVVEKPKLAAKPKPKPKPKPRPKKKKTTIEYVVTVMDLPPIYVKESSTGAHEGRMVKYRAGILKDGFVDGTDWHPPHRIVRVERRDAA